jgi:hypothetical protein
MQLARLRPCPHVLDFESRLDTNRLARTFGGIDHKEAAAIWIITPRGFYSAVAKPADGDRFVTVRARSERDIRNLADLIDAEPSRDDGTDYRWRVRCSKDEWARACATMAREVDYSNFKNRISIDDPERAKLLAQVWDVLYEIQRRDGAP